MILGFGSARRAAARALRGPQPIAPAQMVGQGGRWHARPKFCERSAGATPSIIWSRRQAERRGNAPVGINIHHRGSYRSQSMCDRRVFFVWGAGGASVGAATAGRSGARVPGRSDCHAVPFGSTWACGVGVAVPSTRTNESMLD